MPVLDIGTIGYRPDAGLHGSHPVTVHVKMLRLELLHVKADLERELERRATPSGVRGVRYTHSRTSFRPRMQAPIPAMKILRDTKTLIHHAATAWYSWIRPPRRSRRLISGTIVTGSMWLGLEGTRSSIPR